VRKKGFPDNSVKAKEGPNSVGVALKIRGYLLHTNLGTLLPRKGQGLNRVERDSRNKGKGPEEGRGWCNLSRRGKRH